MPSSKRRNTRRAALGSLLFLGGLFCGTMVAVPKLHRALQGDSTPVDMTCVELVQNGIGQSSVVRLTDATINPPAEKFDLGGLDPDENVSPDDVLTNAKINGAKQTLADALNHPKAKMAMDRIVRGEVLPRGYGGSSELKPLKLTPGRDVAEVAIQEVRDKGSLTVHVTDDPTAKWIVQAADWMSMDLPAPFVRSASIDAYSLHPISMTESKQAAGVWMGISALAMTLGWLLCGSAGWGWWIIFCPIAAVIGLFGLPLRSDRGNRLTWLLGCLIGAALIGGAYYAAFDLGGLGQTESVWMWQAAGFVAVCAGVALWMGVRGSVRARRELMMAVDPLDNLVPTKSRGFSRKSKKKAASKVDSDATTKPKVTVANVAATFKSNTDGVREDDLKATLAKNASYTRRYLDPRLSVPSNVPELHDAIAQTTQLASNGFEEPLVIEIGRNGEACAATIQVGCHDLVLAMTDHLDGQLRLRMLSILDDGHCIVSVDAAYTDLNTEANNEAMTLSIFDVSSANKLLAKHLERTADIAEERHSGLLPLDSNEWRDIVLLSERTMASLMHDAGQQLWEICEMTYGRFSFPIRPVQVLEEA